MARKTDDLADSFATEEPGGWLTRLLADEEELDTRDKWRLGSWAAASLGALVLAVMAVQNVTDRRREQSAAAEVVQQSQSIQRLAKETQTASTRLAAAIEVLNSDRDRLFARVGSLEQNLDSITGSIARVRTGDAKPHAGADQPGSADKPADKAAANPLPEIPAKEPAPAPAVASLDTKPLDTKPLDTKPVDTKSVEPKSVDTRSSASAAPAKKPGAIEPLPAAVAQASGTLPAGTPPAGAPAPGTLAAATVQAAAVPLPLPKPEDAAAPSAPATSSEIRKQPDDKPLAEKSQERPHLEKRRLEPAPTEKPAVQNVAAAMISTTPLMPSRSLLAPPDPGAARLVGPKAATSEDTADEPEAAEEVPAPRTEFGIDLGAANTVEGLRGLWRKLAKQKALKGLQPIIMIKESGNAAQLRLVAGPFADAAAAAKACAALGSADRGCEASVYDGQRLPMIAPAATPQPVPQRPVRRNRERVTLQTEPPPPPPPPPQEAPPPRPSALSSILGIR
uniref:Sporulation domain protein n=1 Tax=Rhodopseudomonas palustris (strain DX-1) TaxID=652103 RepID=E6VK62_RHOPX